jgi:hypothetical protein
MAKISTYPNVGTPTLSDMLIGTEVTDNNATKNFAISDILGLIGSLGLYVPYTGATASVNLGGFSLSSTNVTYTGSLLATVGSVSVFGDTVVIEGELRDGFNQPGTAGQILSSTGTLTEWVSISNVFQYEIHVSQVDGNDTTGDGSLLNPVATITYALTLLTGSRKTIIVHPGSYTENVTVANTNTTIATTELTGANTLLSGTLTIGSLGSGSRISGLKMTNLVISGTAQAYISNCTVDTQVTKSSSGYVEIINSEMQCTLGIQISGSNITIINGNKNDGVSVSNALAQVILKGCNSVVTPSASAGNLAIVDCIVTALGGNAITITGVLTTLTLANSQVLVTAGNNVAPISVAGIYSIINTLYDKSGSTFTGTSTNSISYFQYINADGFTQEGASSFIQQTGANAFIRQTGTNSFIEQTGANSYISQTGNNAIIEQTGTDAYISQAGADSFIEQLGTNASIQQSGTDSTIEQTGIDASIKQTGANAYISQTGTTGYMKPAQIQDSAASFGATGEVLVSLGTNLGVEWQDKNQIGSFFDVVSQPNVTSATARPMIFGSNAISGFGVTITDDTAVQKTQIVVSERGFYSVQFAAQVRNGTTNTVINIWFRKNGTDIANSNKAVTIHPNYTETLSWNYFVSLDTTDVLQIMWSHDNAANPPQLAYQAASAPHPATPSTILTVNRVR